MYKSHLYMNIGPVSFEICSDDILDIDSQYKQFFFESDHHLSVIKCYIKVTNQFEPIHGNLVYQNDERLIFDNDGLETRIHFFNKEPYGIYREIKENEIQIEVISSKIDILFIEMFALEKYLLKENAIILHSSFISYHHKGIVFTAPSGTGKSTQASLWQKYMNADIINGDRSILWYNEKDDCIYCCGLPFCGSSQINKNQIFTLHSIIFISQALNNHVAYVSKTYASTQLFKEISINQWNINAIDQSLDIINTITNKVQLLALECTISKESVDIVREYIN